MTKSVANVAGLDTWSTITEEKKFKKRGERSQEVRTIILPSYKAKYVRE